MLDASPDPLDKNIIKGSTPAVHADAEGRVLFECSDKHIAGNWAPWSLLKIPELRSSETLPQGSRHRSGYP